VAGTGGQTALRSQTEVLETNAQVDNFVLTAPPVVPRAVIPPWPESEPECKDPQTASDALPYDSVGFWRGGDDPTPIEDFYWQQDLKLLPGFRLQPRFDENANVYFGDGGGENQEQAKRLWNLGLKSKANRLGCCGRFGARSECKNRHAFYRSWRCQLRFCRFCGPSSAARLFDRHVVLEKIIDTPKRKGWVLALLDFTVRSTGQLPDAEAIRSINRSVRRVMRKLLGSRKGWGYLWVDEFGFDRIVDGERKGTNLHCHGIYYGPYLEQRKISEAWFAETGNPVVWIQPARRGFRAALWHHLKYVTKPPSNDPQRLAELEVAFNGVRRVHTLGAFYDALEPEKKGEGECVCPFCNSPLFRTGNYCPVSQLIANGLRDVEDVRREKVKQRTLSGSGPP
jgi:hypothetical protein